MADSTGQAPPASLARRTGSGGILQAGWIRLVFFVLLLCALIGLIVGVGYVKTPSSDVTVVDGDTQYVGSCDESVCSWFGIRYAAPPIGPLRFAPPQPPPPPGGMYDAKAMGSICPQGGPIDKQNEDCLFLNIQRPTGYSFDVKLPVLVFFHGGGFESGSGNSNSPRALIEISASNSQPSIVVRINYRLALLGFLASEEMRVAQNTSNLAFNRGFRDMKMATEWVSKHIESFGGDPDRLTIWGQSAGSFGASALMLGHPQEAPFQAAILESGAPGGVPIDLPAAKDAQYLRVLTAANCNSSADHIACLRAKSWQDLRSISLAESMRAMQPGTYARGFYAWTGVIDGGPSQGGFFNSRPSAVIASGEFSRVPVLHGDCLDEGTIFAPQTFNSTLLLSTWLSSIYFSNASANVNSSNTLLNQILQAYPDDPAVGSPYAPITSLTDRFFGPTNQFKRAASLYGDIRYQSNRRLWLSALANNSVPVYGYLYAQEGASTAASLGVPHGSDLGALLQSAPNPISIPYARYYIAFANTHDPSSALGLPTWPVYNETNPVLMQFQNDQIAPIQDTFRAAGINLLNSATALLVTGR